MTDLRDIEIETIDGNKTTLRELGGSTYLIVNVASACGFTRQYEGMQALYEAKQSEGLLVVGFPCNQFGAQEPGTHEEIATFCETQYGVTFPMMAKIEVNGDNRHPLYAELCKVPITKAGKPSSGISTSSSSVKMVLSNVILTGPNLRNCHSKPHLA